MSNDIRFRPSRMVAPLLATALILLLGTAFFLVMIVGVGDGDPVMIAVVIGVMLAFMALLWSWRDRPQAGKRSLFAMMLRRERQAEQTSIRVAKIRRQHQYGDNQPPTLDSVRAQRDPTRTWVPSRPKQG